MHPLVVPVTVYVVLTEGLTVMLADVDPVLHKKVEAPLAVIVTEEPAQIVVSAHIIPAAEN